MSEAFGLSPSSGSNGTAAPKYDGEYTKTFTDLSIQYYNMPTSLPDYSVYTTTSAIDTGQFVWFDPKYLTFLTKMSNIRVYGHHGRYGSYAYTAVIPELTFHIYMMFIASGHYTYSSKVYPAFNPVIDFGEVAIPGASVTYIKDVAAENLQTSTVSIPDIELKHPKIIMPHYSFNSYIGYCIFAHIVSGTNTRPTYGSNYLRISMDCTFSDFA